MGPAVGIGIFTRIENTEVIENSTLQKPRMLQDCAQLERIWNTAVGDFHCQNCALGGERRCQRVDATLPRDLIMPDAGV